MGKTTRIEMVIIEGWKEEEPGWRTRAQREIESYRKAANIKTKRMRRMRLNENDICIKQGMSGNKSNPESTSS